MTDPLDALLSPTPVVAPDPDFARSLRARVVGAISPSVVVEHLAAGHSTTPSIRLRSEETTMTDTPAPAKQSLTPYIAVGDAAAALDWYRDILGAVETTRFVDPDDGRVGHAEIVIGGSTLMLSDAYPEMGVVDPTSQAGSSSSLHLEVVDVDHSHQSAVAAGASSLRAPSDQGHGNRNAVIVDPFGHRWMLSQPIDRVRTEAAQADTGIGGDNGAWEVTGRAPVEPAYISMQTADLARARAFFGRLCGWDVGAGSNEGGGHITNTRFPMGLMTVDDPAEQGPISVYLRVDDIDHYVEEVEALGGRVVERNEYDSGRHARCVDDQGFVFDLQQMAPGY